MHPEHALKLATAPKSPPCAPLRVAVFSGNYNYVMDGPARALNKLVAHIEARGHRALVFAPTTDTPALEHSGELVRIASMALPGSRSEYRLGFGLYGDARRRLDAFNPSILHVAAPDYLGLCALNYAQRRGLPVIASFHTRFDTYPRYYGMRWLEPHLTRYLRYFYGRCNRVYAPSQSMVEALKADHIGKDIRLWARGVDPSLFSPEKRDLAWRRSLGFEDQHAVVAFVGRIVREKGVDVFTDAFLAAQRSTPSLRALVVGDGPERRRFAEMLPGAAFTGCLHGEALARAYSSADIFFNPSITETFGNVTLEAMASGRPSLCAAAAGSVSLVEHGKTGVLIDAAASAGAAFAAALRELANAPAERKRLGDNARRRALEFDWDAILDRLIADYCDVVATADAPAR